MAGAEPCLGVGGVAAARQEGQRAKTVSRAEAVEVALCYDWIDGQSRRQDEVYWLQRFTPRTRRSKWSKLNCEAAEALIRAGKMKPAGLAAVEAAKADSRWAVAYAPPGRVEAPPDLPAALEENPEAAFSRALDARNRHAILYRIQDAKKPETRARRIEEFVAMLARAAKRFNEPWRPTPLRARDRRRRASPAAGRARLQV